MKAIAFLAALLVCIAVAYFAVLPDLFSARATPSALESSAIRLLRKAAIPRDVRERKNPIGLSDESLREGRAHFTDHCAICHGNDGRGHTEMGPNFNPRVPDMTSPKIQSLSDGEIYYAIRHGVRFSGMPAWGTEHGEDDWSDWKLVHFIRHLPKISQDELDEMKGVRTDEHEGRHPHGASPSSEQLPDARTKHEYEGHEHGGHGR